MKHALVSLLTFLLSCVVQAQELASSIHSIDFKAFLIQRDHLESLRGEFSEDACPELIKNIEVQYGRLIGKPTEQAVVQATTCAMGNGGADIEGVFDLSNSGTPVSLTIDDSNYKSDDLYRGQNWTPRLEILHGRLTRWFVMYDKASREGIAKAGWKRVITYKWSKDRFVIADVKDYPSDRER